MVANNRSRERCHCCFSSLLTHHRVVICSHCGQIAHDKCALKFYNFNNITDRWSCWECTSSVIPRYNPFESVVYDKNLQDESDALEEINSISKLLEECSYYDRERLENTLSKFCKSSASTPIFFNNIDGLKSNFDTLSAEISTLKNKFAIIALAETNIDSCDKNLFQLNGYQSVFLAKMGGKAKGSGLGMYVKDDIIFSTNENCTWCTKNLESLFITVTTITSNTLTI